MPATVEFSDLAAPGGTAGVKTLVDVVAESNVELVEGATPGTEFLRLTAVQLLEQTIAAGGSPERIEEWQALLDTPGQWFGTWAQVAAWGRRPAR